MKTTGLISICLICVFGTACASKAVETEAAKKQRAQAAQVQRDLAMDELDSGRAPSHVPDSALSGRSDSYIRAQQSANAAQRELDCEVAGGQGCSAVAKESVRPAPLPQKESVTVAEKARPGSEIKLVAAPSAGTRYPIKDGYPVWFHSPTYDGYLGGVGVAKVQPNGYPAQRRVAISLAQADLARNVKVDVNNELVSERLLVSSPAWQYYQERISAMSRQDADEYLQNPVVMDEWKDEKTGDLYIWVVLPK